MSEVDLTRARLIALERAKLFYNGLVVVGLATVLLSGLVYWRFTNGDGGQIHLLAGLLLLIGVMQFGTWYAWHQSKPDIRAVRQWLYYPLFTSLPSGLCWGAITAYLLPLYDADMGQLMLVAVGASALLSIMLLSALDLMVLLYFAGFLTALWWVFNSTQRWPTSDQLTLLLAVVLGFGMVATGVSVLYGTIARLRAGKRNVSGKLDQARLKMVGLSSRLNDEDERRRDVEQELYLAKEAAEAANMVKGEFLAIMSHEIRTPLNGIVPLLEMLRESSLDREQHQCVNIALNSSYHLLSIINDILDFSKIEAGKLDLESIELNLRELVESVVAMMAKSAERRGLELDYRIAADLPAVVRGDPIRLRQVLTNLVSNAIKFTSRGGVRVDVDCRGRGRKSVDVIFAVKDTGDGISEEIQARLFRSFNQADASTTRKHGGTGLGLVISRRLVELMDGRIGVRSEVGKGSVFWFVVPLRKSLRDMPAERSSLQGVRVLVVGDEDHHSGKLVQYLAEWGVLYQRSVSPMDALSKLISTANLGESWAYELVILDSKSLGGRLHGFLQEINSEPVLGGVKLVIVGEPARSDTRSATDAILARPVKKGELQRVLCRLMDVQSESPRRSSRTDGNLVDPMHYEGLQDRAWPESTPVESLKERATEPVIEVQLLGHVLLVEDNPVNLGVARKMLLRLGLECDVAQDGMAALTAINHHHYDLVLMDCQMPNMDGYEATRAIRLREITKGLARLPVIAMTANAMEGDREKCLDAGMDDYLAKPVMPASLRLMLCQWLPQRDPAEIEAENNIYAPDGNVSKPSVSADTVEQVQQVPELDRGTLDELQEIMEDDFAILLQSFLDAAPGMIREIEAGILDGDTGQVVMPAHSLKSSSANVGALRLSALARQLEQYAKNGDLAAVSKLFEQMKRSFVTASIILHRVCEQGLEQLDLE